MTRNRSRNNKTKNNNGNGGGADGGGSGKKKGPSPSSASKARKAKNQNSKHVKPGSSKGKGKKSLFGPISVQQPKGATWNLTASMGGRASSQNPGKRKRSASSSTSSKSGRSGPANRKKSAPSSASSSSSSFSLQMPIVSQSDPVVPWLDEVKQQAATASSSSPGTSTSPKNKRQQQQQQQQQQMWKDGKQNSMHSSLSVPNASLEKLNAELEAFVRYVQLSDAEVESRQSVISQIQSHCRTLFGVPPESCEVFGSFASLPVCSFSSDVDLAIHDVVPAPETISPGKIDQDDNGDAHVDDVDDDATPRQGSIKRAKTEEEATKTVVEVHPNLKRQARVLKWKAALDEAEEQKEAATEAKQISTETTIVSTSASTTPKVLTETTTKTETVTITKASSRIELATSEVLPASAESNDEGLPLFVIDREGRPEVGGNVTTVDGDTPTVTDTSKDSSIVDDDDEEYESECVNTERVVSGDKRSHDTTSHEKNERKVDSAKELDESLHGARNRSESDEDSADILASLKTRQQNGRHVQDTTIQSDTKSTTNEPVAKKVNDNDHEEEALESRQRSRSIISLCSATTASSTEEKDWDESGMEVSFISSVVPRKLVAIGPSGETRVQVIRALNSLSRKLRRSNFASGQITVRKFAKVPIINMETRFGYECDIAIGGHNGTDTSGYASLQCAKSQSFSIVVLFLKVLLGQHGLDKPFTGGLGSFKLYVLVASHIKSYLDLGGNDSPAEILLTFFFRYGNIPDASRKGMDERLKTPLKQNTVIRTSGAGDESAVAEMSSVYQVDNCVRMFQMCYFVLRRKLQKPSTDPSHSILGYVIDARSLSKERREMKDRVPAISRSRRNGASNEASSVHWSANASPPGKVDHSRKRKATAVSSDQRIEKHEYTMGTDDEADELKAGYGVGLSSQSKGMKAKGSVRKAAPNAKKKNKNNNKRKKSQTPADATAAI